MKKIRLWKFDSSKLIEVNTEEIQDCRAGASTHLSSIRDMAEAVLTGRQPLVDGNEGRKALEIILAIHKSCAEGQEVRLPMKITKEQIKPKVADF